MQRPMPFITLPRDPDGERATEALEKFRNQLARGISLPPKLIIETTPSKPPIWIGIDWAKPE